ncbi:MAG: septation protein IspZ [Alphaproteobacteria bacterium]|nr:septation protein IspZ [Alphaproteobacteria bacterium]
MSDRKLSQPQRLALDLGPLLAFFAANWKFGLLWATGVLMITTFIALAITYWLTHKVARFTLASALFIGLFGALTLYFQDPWYLKMKVTLIEFTFAGVLFIGMAFKRLFIKDLMGEVINELTEGGAGLPDAAWRTLTLRWGLFFVAMGVLNLIIWHFFPDSVWVAFKAFGLMICFMIFAAANAPFLARYLKD